MTAKGRGEKFYFSGGPKLPWMKSWIKFSPTSACHPQAQSWFCVMPQGGVGDDRGDQKGICWQLGQEGQWRHEGLPPSGDGAGAHSGAVISRAPQASLIPIKH